MGHSVWGLSVLNAKIFGIDEQCNLKFGSVLFMNCKNFIIFLFISGPKQMWEIFFFLFLINSSLSPLSSLLSLSHLWISLSFLPSSLPLHSHSLPLSSLSYSADLEPLPFRRSRLKLPHLELPISPGVVSPEAANFT